VLRLCGEMVPHWKFRERVWAQSFRDDDTDTWCVYNSVYKFDE